MSSVTRKKRPVKRPKQRSAKRLHNPEILKFKRIARAVGIPWREVTGLRDELRSEEIESRSSEDAAREAAWVAHCRLNGWSEKQHCYWRAGFARYYSTRIANGCDYLSIPNYDGIAVAVREQCEDYRGWETGDLFEFLIAEREPLQDACYHYRNALARLCFEYLGDETISSRAASDDDTPF